MVNGGLFADFGAFYRIIQLEIHDWQETEIYADICVEMFLKVESTNTRDKDKGVNQPTNCFKLVMFSLAYQT